MADDGATPVSSSAHRSRHSLRDYFARIEAELGEAAANAVAAQQQAWIVAQAAQTQGIEALYSLNIAAAGEATADELRRDDTASGG